MNHCAKEKEESVTVLKKPDLYLKQTDMNLIIFEKECSDEISLEIESNCFVLGYN